MLYLLSLLKKYINIDDTVENIANNLTLKTCEIEGIKQRILPDTLVIGKVLEVKKHPNADKLFITQIDCGKYGKYQIITGGENIVNAVGKYVPVALPGTFLPEIGIKIQSRKMRGEESNGMICSKEEIGIPEDTDKHRIWILNEDFDDIIDQDIGKSLKEKYPWLENQILDVDNKTLTNRPDLTGHFGLAVELNAIYNEDKIKYNKVKDYLKIFDNTNIFELLQNSNKSNRDLDIQTKDCRTYILLELNDIKIKQSNFFVRTLLYDLGMNPKNNWVDFSNIFMYLTGQPIHFFDADKVKGNIVVRNAKNGEKFVDLFDNEYILTENDIVIADEEKILALAGVVGGKDSGVTENTKNILVEIANFDPIKVRKTGVRLGLRTDAEIRFEKNISPAWSLISLILFLDELKYFSKDLGGYKIGGLKYYYVDSIITLFNKRVNIDFNDLSDFITGKIDSDFILKAKTILTKLGFKIEDNGLVKVPFWRSPDDINISEDIYEEVARIVGYEKIEGQSFIAPVKYKKYNNFVKLNRDIEEILVRDLGFDQVETYPWIHKDYLEIFGVDTSKLLSLKNPTAPEVKFLRDNLLFSLLDVIEKNFRNYDEIKIFDIGKIWYIEDKGANINDFDIENLRLFNKDKIPQNIVENTQIGMAIYGSKVKSWKDDVILYLKGILNIILKRNGIKGKLEYVNFNGLESIKKGIFHPKKIGSIKLNGQQIGFVGQLHPIYYDDFSFPSSSQIGFMQLDFSKLLEIKLKQTKGIVQSKYDTLSDQIVWKDLSFVINKVDSYDKIVDIVKKVNEIDDVKVFDIYSGGNLPDDKKSISISIKIKGENLTSDYINKIMKKVIEEVEKVGGKLRS